MYQFYVRKTKYIEESLASTSILFTLPLPITLSNYFISWFLKCHPYTHTTLPEINLKYYIYFLNIYSFIHSFIWLCRVLVVACEIFCCGMRDLVPWPGSKPRPPALEAWSLKSLDRQGSLNKHLKSVWIFFRVSMSQMAPTGDIFTLTKYYRVSEIQI